MSEDEAWSWCVFTIDVCDTKGIIQQKVTLGTWVDKEGLTHEQVLELITERIKNRVVDKLVKIVKPAPSSNG